jgi:hypothetical protein
MDDPTRDEPEVEAETTEELDVDDLDLGADDVEEVKGGSYGGGGGGVRPIKGPL